MPRIAYVNGAYRPHADAAVHIEDRGYQFADGIYEVCLLVGGAFWDLDGHLARWERSLKELSIEAPVGRRALVAILRKMVERNRLVDGSVYMQATRGVAPRNHPFPTPAVRPSLVLTAKAFSLEKNEAQAREGVKVVTAPDIRWGRVDIKTVGLLPNILAKETARRAGAIEALLIKGDKITEGSSSNAWIVDERGVLLTHPTGPEILGGITRDTTLKCARELQMKVEERPFTPAEAARAKEAFITSALNLVMPVVSIDGRAVGDGRAGPIAMRLREAYMRHNGAAR